MLDDGRTLVRISEYGWNANYYVPGTASGLSAASTQKLKPGMAAGFPAGKGDGHHMVNKSKDWAVYLEVGSRHLDDEVVYPDIDLFLTNSRHGKQRFSKKNGEPY